MVIRLKKLLTVLLGVILVLLGLLFLLYGVRVMGNGQENTQAQVNAPVRQIDPDKPMVALTFDDGPYGPVTRRILTALQAVDGRATFFVVGSRLEGREDTLQMIAQSGCEIGNHTYDHMTLRGKSAAEIQNQIQKTDAYVTEITGQATTVLRPPGGVYDKNLCTLTDKPVVLWTIDTLDWSHQNKDTSVERVLNSVQDGDIILMHDLFFPTAEAAEELIPALCEQGYQLVTVSELLRYRTEPDGILAKTG